MTAQLLDGKQLAAALRAQVRAQAQVFAQRVGRPPGLHVVLLGEDPASVVYTRSKERAAEQAGFAGRLHRLPADTSQAALLSLLAQLNQDPAVDGVLVQLPLPPHIEAEAVLRAIDPRKDVDGFHPENVGLLALGTPRLVPCTPQGCMRLLQHSGVALRGARALVLGRSAIVGKPMAQLLLAADTTVTVAHSRSADLPALCREADVLIAAVGRPQLVRGDWIKPGAVVIDVGINRVASDAGSRLVGDVHFAEAAERAAWITPVPGGVGPMTIAELLGNTLRAAELRCAQ